MGGGKELARVRYMSQIKARPPTFVAFVSGSGEFAESSKRFVANLIRKEFGFGGVPLRVTVRAKPKLALTMRSGRRKARG